MGIYNVHDAKTHLSRLLDQVAQGEEVIIAKSGRLVAKLVRVAVEPRQPGRLKAASASPPISTSLFRRGFWPRSTRRTALKGEI